MALSPKQQIAGTGIVFRKQIAWFDHGEFLVSAPEVILIEHCFSFQKDGSAMNPLSFADDDLCFGIMLQLDIKGFQHGFKFIVRNSAEDPGFLDRFKVFAHK